MNGWTRVARVEQIPEGEPVYVDFAYETAAVFRVGDQFYAIEDRCTHDDGPLAEGPLEGYEIMCPRHGAKFDIRSGAVTGAPAYAPVPTYRMKIEDGVVFVATPVD